MTTWVTGGMYIECSISVWHSVPAPKKKRPSWTIVACFHDIGLWSAHTVDYIPPSVSEVKRYLSETGRQEWSEEIGLMVEMHHKARTYKTDRYPLVELFRKGDLATTSPLVSLSLAFLPPTVREVKKAIANNGFHRFANERRARVVCKTSAQFTTLHEVVAHNNSIHRRLRLSVI